MKNIFKLGLALIFCIFFFCIVSADFNFGNSSDNIANRYQEGEFFRGWINVSFNNEDISSNLYDNFGNTIGLKYLMSSFNINYSCYPKDCSKNYFIQGQSYDSKSFSMIAEKLIGFKINGKNAEIQDFKLDVSSNAKASCSSQIGIDFNLDKISEFGNTRYLLESCGNIIKSSCYSTFPEWFLLKETPYCERIKLPKAPLIEIKTTLKKEAGASLYFVGLLKASIYNNKGDFLGECNLPEPSRTGSTVSCSINSVLKDDKPYSVCVSGKEESAISGYMIQARSDLPYCGFYGDPVQTSSDAVNGDYDITVSPKKFADVGSFTISEASFKNQNSAQSLIEILNNYLNIRYKKDCSNTCILPVRFFGINQELTIKDLSLLYSSEGSGGVITKAIYDVNETDTKITTNFSKISIENLSFYTPFDEGNYTWILFLGNKQLLQKNITVYRDTGIKVLSIFPSVVTVASPTAFSASLDFRLNPSDYTYSWDFGDNSSVFVSSDSLAGHTYTNSGNYTVKVSMFQEGNELSTAYFNVNVTSPKEAIGQLISYYKDKISSVKSQINSLPENYRESINQKIDIPAIDSSLLELETLYNQKIKDSKSKDSDYLDIMSSLNEIEFPESIQFTEKSQQNLITEPDIIDLNSLSDLFEENFYENEVESYKNKIYKWNLENLDLTIDYRKLSYYSTSKKQDILGEFQISINPKREIEYPVYLVIKEDKSKILFDKEYDISEYTGFTGIKLDSLNSIKIISFAVFESISPDELPIFTSPKLSQLTNIYEPPEKETGHKWRNFFIGILVLLILTLGVYILLQEWYKKNYEKSLFKDKNRLYNLIYFISNAKKQNKSDNEILKILRTKGWKTEQINYALKKFKGQRIGMWEIPLFSSKEKKNIKKEIAKREQKKLVY